MVRLLRLRWDAWTEEHATRHGVDREVVEDVARNAPYMTRARGKTYRVIGQTDGGRYLILIVAPRPVGAFYVVTARDTDESERRAYRRR